MSEIKEPISEELEEKFQELFKMMDLFEEQDKIRKKYGQYITLGDMELEVLDITAYGNSEYIVLRDVAENSISVYEIIDNTENGKKTLISAEKQTSRIIYELFKEKFGSIYRSLYLSK